MRQSGLFGNEICVFCQIASKEKESMIVFEDESTIAFLDIKPLFPGHVLLVPKKHYPNFDEIPDETVRKLFADVKKLDKAIEKALGADGTFIAINNKVSQSIPHVHIHVVPRRFKDGFRGFFWPRHAYGSDEEMLEVKSKIIKAMD